MISLFKLLKKQGISVGENMKPEDMITILSSVPSILSQFPTVSSSVNTLQSILNTYNSAKDTLSQAISNVESAEKHLSDMKSAYEKALQIPAMAYQGTGVGTVVVNPLPELTTAYLAITTAESALEKAKDFLQQAQNNVLNIENQLKDKVSSIVKLVFTSKV